MARKLKTYQTSLGFFDQAIAAPSMKAALEAWGADSNLFHQGAARGERRSGRDRGDHGKAGRRLKKARRFDRTLRRAGRVAGQSRGAESR